jgi:glycosyltransferase involved in cell wall biosynthesis
LKTILCLGHDANRAGAQLVLLDLLRRLHQTGRFRLRLLLGDGGPLLADYQAVAEVTLRPATDDSPVVGALADRVLDKLGLWRGLYDRRNADRQRAFGTGLGLDSVDLVLINTVSSSRLFAELTPLGLPASVPVVTFVHELAMAVEMYSQPDELRSLLARTSQLLAVSRATAEYYVTRHGVDRAIVSLFTLIDIPELDRRIAEARALPDPYPTLGLPPGAVIIGGCGNAEWRKGCDLFITLARLTLNELDSRNDPKTPPVYFVWVGMPPGQYADQLQADIDKAGMTEFVRLLLPTPDVLRYSTRFDAFALTSREDPYPLVVFEAGLSGVPVVCFAGAGGAPELVGADAGRVVPYLQLDEMRDALTGWVRDPAERRQLGAQLDQKIRQRHNPADAMATLDTVFARLLPND